MGKTKTKIIDDSLPAETKVKADAPTVEPKQSASAKATVDKESKNKPKDALAASLLEELNKEFGEVKKEELNIKNLAPREERPKETKKPQVKEEEEIKKTQPKAKVKPRGKKYQEAIFQVDKLKKYTLKEAVELAQKASYSKFVGTMEVHINTNQKNVRGLVTLPFAAGKKLKILAFGPSTHSTAAQGRTELDRSETSLRVNKDASESDEIIRGDNEILAEIEKGKFGKGTRLDFDVIVATPEWMSKLAKVARILGPKGLMPNPKNCTVTDNLEKTVKELQGGKVEYKTEPNNQVIHLGIGKTNQPIEEIASNVKSLYQVIGKTKISKITISPTMGPGVKVNLASI